MIGTLGELPRPSVGGLAMTGITRIGRAAAPASTVARWSTAAIFATDCATQLDPSIPYALPLVLIRRDLAERRPLIVALLVVATFVGYAVSMSISWGDDSTMLNGYGLINRALVAVVLMTSSAVLAFAAGAQLCDGFRDDFDRLLASLVPILIVALSITLVAGIFLADLFAPSQYNLPIVYVLPVVLIAAAGSGRLVWIAVPLGVLLTIGGYVYGPEPRVNDALFPWLLANRTLAVGAVVGTALLLLRHHRSRSPVSPRTPTNPSPA